MNWWKHMLLGGLVVGGACSTPPSKPSLDPADCGNGELDPGELCDPEIASGEGACPTDCGGGDACGGATLTGEADECTAQCVMTSASCGPADGCCPSGCTRASDDDCPIDCNDPQFSSSPACAGGGRISDLDRDGVMVFCDSIPSGTYTCGDGVEVEIPGGQECYDGIGSLAEICPDLLVDELRSCLENPCALETGSAACQPFAECVQDQ